jgi:hypothetical protein
MAGVNRRRLWIETALACTSFVLLLVTVVWHDWIEVVLRVDPDGGSGLAEVLVGAALLAVALVSALFAHREWRPPTRETVRVDPDGRT